jgi:4-hydroxy-2-oxoglutarate aldolase
LLPLPVVDLFRYNVAPMKPSGEANTETSSRRRFSAENLSGILLPIPTPFNRTSDVDANALRANIEQWNATGIAGCAVLGSTGERVHLDEGEYLQVIEVAREAVPNHLAFIVGAGQQSTRATINEIRSAADRGADAVLVITPYFYRSAITQTTLLDHYAAIADVSPVPLILYSMPALTGIKIEPETIAQLSEHPNIIGVKDSSADIEGFGETVKLVHGNSARRAATGPGSAVIDSRRDEFAVLTGNGTVLYEALRAGADGGILAVGCVAPRLCLELFRAVKAGEHEQAELLQEKLTPLAHTVTTKYGIGGLKAALDFVGYFGGPVRAPLRSPNEAARSEIVHLLQDALAKSVTSNQQSVISNQ